MENRKIMFTFLLTIFISLSAYSQNNPVIDFWITAGYEYEVGRIREGKESIIPGIYTRVDEIDRWLSAQYVSLDINARVMNNLYLNFDTSLLISGIQDSSFENELRQLYIMFNPWEFMSMTFGIQEFKWGPAKCFHAIDKLDTTDPLSHGQERKGIPGIKLELIPTDWFSFSLVGIPEESFQWNKYAARFDFMGKNADIGIGFLTYHYTDITWLSTTEVFTYNSMQYAGFLDFECYFGNLGIYGELMVQSTCGMEYCFEIFPGEYEFNRYQTVALPGIRTVGGIHYRMGIPPYINFILEYFYNHCGLSDNKAKGLLETYAEAMESNPGGDHFIPEGMEILGNLRKHYMYLGMKDIIITDKLNLSAAAIANLDTLFFNFYSNISIAVNDAITVGLTYDFYHQFLRVKKYPSLYQLLNKNHKIALSVMASY